MEDGVTKKCTIENEIGNKSELKQLQGLITMDYKVGVIYMKIKCVTCNN